MKMLRSMMVAALAAAGFIRADAGVQVEKLSEEAAAIKNHSRVTVSFGKELRKEELKSRSYYCGGGYRKELHTQKSIEIKIRNTGTDTIDYTVAYYFVGKPFDGGTQPKIYDRGIKTVSCEPNHNVSLDVKSKELTAVDKRSSQASPRERKGLEADAYFVCVSVKGEEIMSLCSRSGDKYEQTLRDQIANKKEDKDENVKVKNDD